MSGKEASAFALQGIFRICTKKVEASKDAWLESLASNSPPELRVKSRLFTRPILLTKSRHTRQ
jgi:hypothetical protein